MTRRWSGVGTGVRNKKSGRREREIEIEAGIWSSTTTATTIFFLYNDVHRPSAIHLLVICLYFEYVRLVLVTQKLVPNLFLRGP